METTRVIGKRILLVEDERWVRECIKRVLALDAHEITEASNGLEAVEMFAEGLFDVVITDYDMPKMTGDELAHQIRNRAPRQPILMITACAEQFGRLETPAIAILEKPFGIAELRQVLANLLS
jgi:two-component system, cell cycle sensor histidine kinase and response regulator CckA